MTRYLISIADGAMGVSDEKLPDVADAAHEVVEEGKDAGVWVFGIGEPSSSPVRDTAVAPADT